MAGWESFLTLESPSNFGERLEQSETPAFREILLPSRWSFPRLWIEFSVCASSTLTFLKSFVCKETLLGSESFGLKFIDSVIFHSLAHRHTQLAFWENCCAASTFNVSIIDFSEVLGFFPELDWIPGDFSQA